MPVISLALALLGLAIGSFLTVVIGRVPSGASVIAPASHCPRCKHSIRNRHNVPVLGWLVLRGRCRDCALPISARYPMIELLTAETFVLVGAAGIASGHTVLTITRLIGAAALIAVVVIAVDANSGSALPAVIVMAVAVTVDAVATAPGQLLVIAVAALFAATAAVIAHHACFAAPLALASAGAVHLLAGIPLEQLVLAATVFVVVSMLTVLVPSDRFTRAGRLTRLTRSAA